MTDKDIRKLNRLELLELMVSISEENETLKKKIDTMQEKLDAREIEISSAGSIAEASLELSGVFEAAQDAADRYIENIRKSSEAAKKTAKAEADALMAKTKKECDTMQKDAKRQVQEKWKSLKKMLDDYMKDNSITKAEVQNLVAQQRETKVQKPEIN